MFMTLRHKLKDLGTLSALCKEAERTALSAGSQTPGSEHFVLACLAMKDNTARRALASLGATPEAFGDAIRAQFDEALRHAGMQTPADERLQPASAQRTLAASTLYHAAPSGQTLVQRLAAAAEGRKMRSLLAADVLLAAAEEEFSIAARALRVLGITRQALVQAASRQIALHEGEQRRA